MREKNVTMSQNCALQKGSLSGIAYMILRVTAFATMDAAGK